MLTILLIGRNGQLGWELQRTLTPLGKVVSLDYPEIDLAKPADLRALIRTAAPQIIVNAAAYTNVDKAESEPELVRKINAEAPAVMAEEAARIGAALVHYSTDYVFDGTKSSSYDEGDEPHPLNEYGRSKLQGEEAVAGVGGSFLIFRTSWVYSLRQGGFVTKVLQWARQQETLRVVDDQTGSPTWARTLAEATSLVIARGGEHPQTYLREKSGLYHLAGAGSATRYEWAKRILDLDPAKAEQKVRQLLPARTADFPTPALRPVQTGLSIQKFKNEFGLTLPPWEESLRLLLD